jgi:hypothetical protein
MDTFATLHPAAQVIIPICIAAVACTFFYLNLR